MPAKLIKITVDDVEFEVPESAHKEIFRILSTHKTTAELDAAATVNKPAKKQNTHKSPAMVRIGGVKVYGPAATAELKRLAAVKKAKEDEEAAELKRIEEEEEKATAAEKTEQPNPSTSTTP